MKRKPRWEVIYEQVELSFDVNHIIWDRTLHKSVAIIDDELTAKELVNVLNGYERTVKLLQGSPYDY